MRIATLQTFISGVNGMATVQNAVNLTQQQLSSGRRVLTPADDPIAATKILQIENDLAQRAQYDSNMTAAQNRLSFEEVTLGSVVDALTRLQELTVNAGSGTLTQLDRQAISAEVEEIEESLVNLFNSKDSGGDYIFAGFKGSSPPFVDSGNGRYEFVGDEGQRSLSIGNSTKVATGDSGKYLFVDVDASKNTFTTSVNPQNQGSLNISAGFVVDDEAYADFYPDDLIVTFNSESAVNPPGPNYTIRRASDNRVVDGMENRSLSDGGKVTVAGISFTLSGQPKPGDEVFAMSSSKQSITDTVFRLREGLDSLEDTPEDAAILTTLIEDTLQNLEMAQSSVSETRSNIGARLNIIDTTRDLSDDIKLANKQVLSELQDVDFAEATSRLSLETFLLEAAQKSYAAISRLSLFNQL